MKEFMWQVDLLYWPEKNKELSNKDMNTDKLFALYHILNLKISSSLIKGYYLAQNSQKQPVTIDLANPPDIKMLTYFYAGFVKSFVGNYGSDL